MWPRLLLPALLGVALLAAWLFGLPKLLSLDTIAGYRAQLDHLAAAHPVGAGALYGLAYAAVVTVSVPAGPLLTMVGGLFFGIWFGTALALTAATFGSAILFLVVRSAAAPSVGRHAGAYLDRLRPGLEHNGFWYLLALRLLPLVPFPVGSIVPALVGMRLAPFALATALGILPSTAIFASIGAGLDRVLAQGGKPDTSIVFSWPVLLPLTGLAVLSLLAAWWRRRTQV
jgi:uncharacterized membrane protein YdjX (TVP38/TMEM64 family)